MLPHRVLLPRLSTSQRAHASGMGEQRTGRRAYRGRHSEVRATRRESARGRGHRIQQGIRVHSIGERQIHSGEFPIRGEQSEEPILEHISLWVIASITRTCRTFLFFSFSFSSGTKSLRGTKLYFHRSARMVSTGPPLLFFFSRPTSVEPLFLNPVSLSSSRYIATFNFVLSVHSYRGRRVISPPGKTDRAAPINRLTRFRFLKVSFHSLLTFLRLYSSSGTRKVSRTPRQRQKRTMRQL